MKNKNLTNYFSELLKTVSGFIEKARKNTAYSINRELIELYWKIGKALKENILEEKRAEYGKQIIKGLSVELTKKYGIGFTETNLRYFLKFADIFPDQEIPHTLCDKLSWSHIM